MTATQCQIDCCVLASQLGGIEGAHLQSFPPAACQAATLSVPCCEPTLPVLHDATQVRGPCYMRAYNKQSFPKGTRILLTNTDCVLKKSYRCICLISGWSDLGKLVALQLSDQTAEEGCMTPIRGVKCQRLLNTATYHAWIGHMHAGGHPSKTSSNILHVSTHELS